MQPLSALIAQQGGCKAKFGNKAGMETLPGLSPLVGIISSGADPFHTALGVMRELWLPCYQDIPNVHGVVPCFLPRLWLGRLLSFF